MSRDAEIVVVDMDETMVTKSRYPIREVVDAVNRLAYRVVIVTGREEEQRERTIEDLRYAAIGYDDLLMLPELGQDIAAFKRDAVQELMRDYEVIAFIDDNGDNRDAVESLGVYVMTPEEFVEAARESGLFDDYEDDEDEDEPESEFETRAEVNRVAPGFMAASARRGLRLHQEGHSGDGLMPATVADARRMAEGEPLSEGKWRRIPGWIARHMMDLDAVDGDEITPGLVAMLLWGGGSSKSSARRAQAYAERVVERLDGNEERAPAPKKDQIKGSDDNPAGSAADKSGDIEISEETEKALQNKADEHNDAMAERDRPAWTRVRVGALRAVYRRGAGAFSTSHRPGVSRGQWAMARVNAFLHLARTGSPENPKYVSDNDLLHSEHPKYSGERAALDDGEVRYDALQPRAPDGKWTSGGGGAAAGDTGGDTPGGGAPSGGGSTQGDVAVETPTGAKSKVYVDEDIEGMAMNGDPMYPEVVGDAIYSDQISHIEGMDSATANAVINYTGHGYVNTNKALRGAPPPPIENQQVYVEALERGKLVDTAIRTAPPLEEGIITYRGVSARALGVDTPSQAATLVGGEFSDKGIVSTSLAMDIGGSFTTMGGSTTEKTVLLEMRVPRGSKALYVEPISDATGEFEVLLPSSSKFSIIDSRTEQGQVIITVDVKTP